MKLGELFFELGFKADTTKLRDFAKHIGDLNMSSILAGSNFGLLYEGAKKIIGAADDMALQINKFGNETGQSRKELQQWSAIADGAGVSAGVVVGGIKQLQDSIFKMRFTGEGSNIWQMIGIDPTKDKDKFETLYKLGIQLNKMDTDTQRFFLNQLGLSDEWLSVLPYIVKHHEELGRQLYRNDASLEKMAEYHRTVSDLSTTWKITMDNVAVSIIPIVTGLAHMTQSINENIIKSAEWQGIMMTIGEAMDNLAHPGETILTPLKKLIAAYKMDSNNPLVNPIAVGGSEANWGPATRIIQQSAGWKVTVPITVQTNDPHYFTKKLEEHLEKVHNDVRDQSSRGSV